MKKKAKATADTVRLHLRWLGFETINASLLNASEGVEFSEQDVVDLKSTTIE